LKIKENCELKKGIFFFLGSHQVYMGAPVIGAIVAGASVIGAIVIGASVTGAMVTGAPVRASVGGAVGLAGTAEGRTVGVMLGLVLDTVKKPLDGS
jgi:hypothetical protein